MNTKISTKIYLGFGVVLLLAVMIAAVGVNSLINASDTFVQYRTLARQTNADGRIQANMLMTRIFAKNFVIEASPDNIEGVKERAARTLQMIEQSKELTDSDSRELLVDDLKQDLENYVSRFEKVTEWQAQRNELVNNRLNVLGPATERTLTTIMESALKDGDTTAAYQAGVTLRSLMLGRLYANRFLIENDEASVDRAMREFRDMELHVDHLLNELQDPKRRELANTVRELQSEYLQAFVNVRRVIGQRNILIEHHMDRIGPEVADRIERLKLAIKHQQDTLGPEAQSDILKAEAVTTAISVAAIIIGILVAGWIAAGVTRPILALTSAAESMAAGNLDQEIDTRRNDEIGTLANAFVAMRSAIDDKVKTLQNEIGERTRAEEGLAAAQADLKKANEELEGKVAERTAELAEKEEQLRVALTNMSDGIFTLDPDFRFSMFNDRYLELTGFPREAVQQGVHAADVIRHAAENGYYGEGDPEELTNARVEEFCKSGYIEVESSTPDGLILHYRKTDMADGGSIVVVSDVTERRKAERELKQAFKGISSSIKYASRIQKSILPPEDILSERFDDHFVHWDPRDVVGGDVYWYREWGDGALVVLGDCTGHGVPGAFMTLISNGALERAMADVDVGDVATMVQRMHQLLREALGQDTGDGAADDGLELGACFIEPAERRLTFVGARFDLFVVNSGHVEEIRSGKKGIGYREVPNDFPFEATIVEASPETRFYMTTDGAIDQISDTERRRFGKKRFKDLLLSVQEKSMASQGDIIRDAILSHQGSAPRLDDIAIIGFKI